jgi:RNA polymerase sigma-70 factor (ECF subfamily)
MPPVPASVPDALIVRRVLAGDTEAFATLVARYSDRCARCATRIVGNREDAEEAVQDAFVRAYAALGEYRECDRFYAWLFRILINQCRSVVARSARRERTFPDLDLDTRGVDALEATFTLDDRFADRDRLERALAQLGPDQREAVVLHLGEELTYEEMALATGAGVSALKMRVARGVARLRALLTEVYSV